MSQPVIHAINRLWSRVAPWIGTIAFFAVVASCTTDPAPVICFAH